MTVRTQAIRPVAMITSISGLPFALLGYVYNRALRAQGAMEGYIRSGARRDCCQQAGVQVERGKMWRMGHGWEPAISLSPDVRCGGGSRGHLPLLATSMLTQVERAPDRDGQLIS